jgi:hypothetical protein
MMKFLFEKTFSIDLQTTTTTKKQQEQQVATHLGEGAKKGDSGRIEI